jgi:hypothetical protein
MSEKTRVEELMLNLIRAKGDVEKTRARDELKQYCATNPTEVKQFARSDVNPSDYAKAVEKGMEVGTFLMDVWSAIKGRKKPPA